MHWVSESLMLLAAVFLLSLASIAFEVLLARVFSIGQWNHLSFMVISIALFGFAASGTLLSIIDTRSAGWAKRFTPHRIVSIFTTLYTASAIVSFLATNYMPMDYFRLPLEPIQAVYLLIAYLLLSLPFFFTGLVISLSYMLLPDKTGYIYFATMTGSAFGALLPLFVLPYLGEGKLILVSALIPILLTPFITVRSYPKQIVFSITSLGTAIAVLLLINIQNGSIVDVKMSPYKSLKQMLQFPGTHITETHMSMRGIIDLIESPFVRFAPGLSLKFMEELPRQWAASIDGENLSAFYNLNSQKDMLFSKFMLSYAGYLLSHDPEKVLLIHHGGGSAIPCAMASGAREIVVVEQNPTIARWIHNHYRINVINQNPRIFLARSDRKFHVIQIENWGFSIPGSSALNQEYLFTIEALMEYYKHLDKNGVIIISRKLLLPPADSIRLCASAFLGLKSLGIENPDRHIAILRDWGTFTLFITKNEVDVVTVKKFVQNSNFDIVYLFGADQETANRFNIFDESYHFSEMDRLLNAFQSGTETTFFRSYLLDVAPQRDSRPFPGKFLKWNRLKDIYKSTGSRFYSILMSGEVVVAVVLFEAFLVAILLLLLPILVVNLKRKKSPRLYQIFYFLSVGAGFMFVEMYFIKMYTLLFGDPVISFAVVLAGFLVFSGAGGYWSQRLSTSELKYLLGVLLAVLLSLFWGLNEIVHKMLGLSNLLRYLIAVLLLLPPGLIIGLPFPLGMRCLLHTPSERAYAWTANGCASVLTSIISALIALSSGIPVIIACAFISYSVTLASVLVLK
jgi:hypothetical protein